jgi:hypothetical protein
MNERIRELYQQAHSIRYHDGDPMRDGNPPTVYWQGEKSAEKFAELIVGECIGVVEGGSFLHDQAPTALFAKVCSGAIKRYFGVEE